RTAERVQKILVRHARSLEPDEDAGDDPLAEQPALAGCASAAARGVDLLGERAGRPTLRLLDPDRARPGDPVAEVMGFNVHAARAIAARDRQRLEQLCRYLCRPPIAQQRLELSSDGRVRYTMKKPWRDGTLALVFEPQDLVARLCAMVPPPRWHLIRFHGVLSAHASLRSQVVPPPPATSDDAKATCASAQLELFSAGAAGANDVDSGSARASREPSRKPWAWLLRHVFAADLQTCQRCGGRMRWQEVATTPDAIARLLARHGLGSGPGPPPQSRQPRRTVPEQLELGFRK
ncbi:MAG: transposase, partial [Vitreimonas sp.]